MLRCPDSAPSSMPSTLSRVPKRRWTYADYCKIPPDRKRHEIIDGRHYVNPGPSPDHQSVGGRLYIWLFMATEHRGRGRVFFAPLDVHLGPGTVVQPDVVFMRVRKASIIGRKKLVGAPDLVIEVLSPSNRAHDRTRKFSRYERAGVREYWLVDPDACTVEPFVLRRGKYVAMPVETESITLRVMRGVTIDLREVWSKPR